jgi:hypothetical protein
MAKLFLDTTDTSYKVSNSNTEIFGANGTQAITIDGALTGIVLDANVERVAFSGTTSDYKYKQVGTDLEVYNAAGVLVTKVGLQDDTNGTLLTFANGTVDAKFAPSTTGLGLTVGGQTVATTAPTAVTIPAANIDVVTFPITAPTLSVASVAATATEGTNAIWTVTLANPATTATTVKYTLTNVGGASNADTTDETVVGTGVTATASVETAPNSGIWEGTLTFAAGATTATLSLPVALDGLTETGEGVSLSLSNPSTNAIINDAGKSATVSFVDAPATTFTLTSTGTGVEVQEGNTITFTVTPNAQVNAATTLILNVNGKVLGSVSSTTSAADFENTSTITFAQGETAPKTITLKVATDTAVEGREAYAAEVIDTTSYTARSNTLQGVITDKLPTLSLTQNVSTVAEGSTVTYTVTSDTAAPAGGLTVPFTVAGTATSGSDYTALTTGSITIAAGATTGTVTLATIADTFTDGADETVIVTLGDVSNANVSATAKTVTTTITDSSKALGTTEMTLTGATSVNEGSTVTYTVTLGAAATTALSIPYTLTGTATSGTDFTGSTGTISVAAGSKTGTLTLTTVNDSTTEGAETVTLTLGSAGGFIAASGQGAVTTTINDTSLTVAGSSLVLTTGVDNITGTTGNDTIIADNSTATKQLTVADQINGGDGVDTLKIYLRSDTATLANSDTSTGQPTTLTSIENVWLNGGNVSAYTAPTGTTGLTIEAPVIIVKADGSAVDAGSNTYTVAGQSLTLKDFVSTTSTSTAAAASAAKVFTTNISSTADTVLNLTVNNVASKSRTHTDTTPGAGGTYSDTQTIDLTGTKFATLNLTATGSNSSFTLANTGAALTALNVSGDKNVTLTESINGLKTINASTATGAVSVDASGATADAAFAFTGGTGNDKLTLKAGAFALITAGGQLNGGAGTDTLAINDTTPVYAKINAAQNFETLALDTTGATVDASLLTSIKSFSVKTGTEIINNLGTGNSVAITAATTSVSLGAAVGNTATDITIGSTSGAGFTTTALVTTGLTTVSLTSNGTSTQTITTLTNSENTNFTVKGAGDLTITNALVGTTTGNRVDASAFTGKLSLIGSPKNDVIIGGSGADTLQGAANGTANQADVLTGGAGADKFVFKVAAATGATFFATSAGTSAITKITDFVAGTDKFDFITTTPLASATVANPQTIATAADLTAVYAGITAIAASTTTVASTAVITVSAGAAAGTYLYVNDIADAGVSNTNDMLINITGLSGTITANDFIFA